MEFQQQLGVQQQQQQGLASMPSWFAAGLADADATAGAGAASGSRGCMSGLDTQLLDEQLLLQRSMSPGSVRLPRASLGLLGQVPLQQQQGQCTAAAAAEFASSSQMDLGQQQQQGSQQGGVQAQQGADGAVAHGGAAAAAEAAQRLPTLQ